MSAASSPRDPDSLPLFWWLVLPIAVAIVLILLAHGNIDFYLTWLNAEDKGVMELSHVVIPLLALIVALRILFLPQLRQQPWLYLWVGLAAFACVYIAGEEASWGQHYLGWVTPESWMEVNDQGETNLHNTSSWFDQKPRLLLEVGVILGGIVVPLMAWRRPSIRQHALAIVLPPMICLPTAVIAEFAKISERLISLAGGNTFIFYRASEVQELYFYYFILLYLIVLRRRLSSQRDFA